MCYIIKAVPFCSLVLNTVQNRAAVYVMYWNCRPLKQFSGTGVLLVQFYLYLIFDTHLQYRNQCREWLKIGLSHVVSPGAITTPSLAQAPGISPTWQQCTQPLVSWRTTTVLTDVTPFWKLALLIRNPHIFQKPTSHFKILGTTKVTRSTSHFEDP
jgi:hypothetical protein